MDSMIDDKERARGYLSAAACHDGWIASDEGGFAHLMLTKLLGEVREEGRKEGRAEVRSDEQRK